MFLFRPHSWCHITRVAKETNNIQMRNISNQTKPILYGDEASPPVRFVMMTAFLLKIDLDFRRVDLFKGENKIDSYKRINPLQKVPALSINDEVICDSHAIALYLCRSSKNHGLYPKELVLRSKIDELMYFNSSVLFPLDSAIFTDFFAGRWPLNADLVKKWSSALDYLELKLNKHTFLSGDEVHLCDLCCATTVSSLEILLPVLERQEKVRLWLKNLKTLACFNINMFGLDRLKNHAKLIRPI